MILKLWSQAISFSAPSHLMLEVMEVRMETPGACLDRVLMEHLVSCQNIVHKWGFGRRILSAWEKTPNKPGKKPWDLSFFKTMKLLLEHSFVPRPGVLNRRELTLDYPSQLAIVICLCAFMEKRDFLAHVAYPCGCKLYSGASSLPSEYKIAWCSEFESWLLPEILI